MNLYIKLIVFACLIVSIYGAAMPFGLYGPPMDEDSSSMDESVYDQSGDENLLRRKRFTCDFLSFQSQWATPNHSACAAKCMAQGRKGGTCQNGICVCRQDKWWKWG